MSRRRRLLREIARDHALARSALCRELLALVGRVVDRPLGPRASGMEALHRELEAIVARSRARVRALNDRRIERRGGGGDAGEGVELLGDFATMVGVAAAAAAEAIEGASPQIRGHLDLDGLALSLHVRGEVWSSIEGGAIRAFRRRRAGGRGEGDEGG